MANAKNLFFIRRLELESLWGHQDYDLHFHDDVNVIIGPNASGKTTLIKLLHDLISGNADRLVVMPFKNATVELASFDDGSARLLRVDRSEEKTTFRLDDQKISVPFGWSDDQRFLFDSDPERLRRRMPRKHYELLHTLRTMVRSVWLPVSRRLPISYEEDGARAPLHRRPLESVDESLSSLLNDLRNYAQTLNSRLADLRKDFQRHALENILYDEKHDKFSHKSNATTLTEGDERQLLQAYQDVGLSTTDMTARVRKHFNAAREAVKSLEQEKEGLDIDDVLVLPLIARTRALIGYAHELEERRLELFKPITLYAETVSGFLSDKAVSVTGNGDLFVVPRRDESGPVDWRHLSSGEKQILILLTQALISSGTNTVYVADEPELSLHVTWQEKLLKSLTSLAGRCQFIIATHSPDVVAGFGDKVIDLAEVRR